MSDKEKKALETISAAVDKMSDYQKGRLVGYAERMEEEKQTAGNPPADDAAEE